MASFSWLDVAEVPFFHRYVAGQWAGHQAWSQMSLAMLGELMRTRRQLTELRRDVHYGLGSLKCPRLFISHRRADKDEARRIAKIATECGFQYWLDVLDPDVTWLKPYAINYTDQMNYTMLVADVVETALLNCSHVLAMITPHTPADSTWEPYEFGRAKDQVLCSSPAACWLHPARRSDELADYTYLGDVTSSEEEIRRWLQAELAAWQARFRFCCPDGAGETWAGGRVKKLPVYRAPKKSAGPSQPENA